jgi:hypothetical protein
VEEGHSTSSFGGGTYNLHTSTIVVDAMSIIILIKTHVL